MKLNKKGFTLVELLAVIVVLAIIALIGYTAVGDVMEESRKNTAAITASSVEEAAEEYCMSEMSKNAATAPTDFELADLAFDSNGSTVEITNGTISDSCATISFGSLKINGYTCTKTNGKWSCATPSE